MVVANVIRPLSEMGYPGLLRYVCTRCWMYVRPTRWLSEPCWGCNYLQAMGFEL